MKRNQALVSVIIPLYNNRRFVEKAVKSVFAQKDIQFECIVVNDGSSDGGESMLLEKFGSKISVINQSNKGISAARNQGVKTATGKYLAFLDADDYWAPTKLRHQVTFLETHPDFAAVYCQGLRVDEEGKLIYRKPFGFGIRDKDFQFTNSMANPKSPALGSTLLIKFEVFDVLHGFDEHIFNAEDTEFRLRLALAGYKQHMLTSPLAFIRYSSTSVSHSFEEKRWELNYYSHLLIYEKFLKNISTEIDKKIAEEKILNFQIRQLLYYLYIGKQDNARDLRNQIKKRIELFDKKSGDFYTQIEFFTPLIYLEDGWPALEKFIDLILAERSHFMPKTENAIQDELAKIKAIVWCAGQALGGKFKFQAWRYLINACAKDFRLILNKNFWIQAVRLLIGNFAIWLNIKWQEISLRM